MKESSFWFREGKINLQFYRTEELVHLGPILGIIGISLYYLGTILVDQCYTIAPLVTSYPFTIGLAINKLKMILFPFFSYRQG